MLQPFDSAASNQSTGITGDALCGGSHMPEREMDTPPVPPALLNAATPKRPRLGSMQGELTGEGPWHDPAAGCPPMNPSPERFSNEWSLAPEDASDRAADGPAVARNAALNWFDGDGNVLQAKHLPSDPKTFEAFLALYNELQSLASAEPKALDFDAVQKDEEGSADALQVPTLATAFGERAVQAYREVVETQIGDSDSIYLLNGRTAEVYGVRAGCISALAMAERARAAEHKRQRTSLARALAVVTVTVLVLGAIATGRLIEAMLLATITTWPNS